MGAKLPHVQPADDLVRAIHDELVAQFGVMLTPTALAKALSYPSANAFRQAVARGTVPVPLFRVEHRRGYFALARDVAAWLSLLRQNAEESRQHPAEQSAAIAPRASAIVSSRARSQIQRDKGAAIE